MNHKHRNPQPGTRQRNASRCRFREITSLVCVVAARIPARRSLAVRICAGALLCALAALAPAQSRAQEDGVSANSVKAAFLYHFAGYVDWPPQRASGPVIIGVIGAEEIVGELRQLLPGRNIDGRPVRVRSLSPGDDLSAVHILFIGEGERRTRQIIDELNGSPTLTVTDSVDGLDHGAMIGFVIAERRVRFEISTLAAERAGLKLSSRLLAVALRVRSTGALFHRTPFA